MDSSC